MQCLPQDSHRKVHLGSHKKMSNEGNGTAWKATQELCQFYSTHRMQEEKRSQSLLERDSV